MSSQEKSENFFKSFVNAREGLVNMANVVKEMGTDEVNLSTLNGMYEIYDNLSTRVESLKTTLDDKLRQVEEAMIKENKKGEDSE